MIAVKRKLLLGVIGLAVLSGFALGQWLVSGGLGSGGIKSSDEMHTEQKSINSVYELKSEDVIFDEEGFPAYVSGVVSVWFTPDASESDRQAAIESVGGEEIGRLDAFEQVQIRVDAEGEDELQEVCAKLEENDCVDFAELERLMQGDTIRSVPDDPWGSAGVLYSSENYWASLMDVPEAWSRVEQYGSSSVTLGVVDNGFDTGHEDLAGVLEFASDADIDNRNVREHGTHVSGLMAASWDNGVGLSGVMPHARLLCYDACPVKDADESNDYFTDSQLLMGLNELVKHDAKVINFSQGSSSIATQDQIDSESRMFSRSVGMLLNEGYDFIVVQSAGNSGVDASSNGLFSGITEANCDTTFASFSEIDGRILIVGACDGHYTTDGYDVIDDHFNPNPCDFSNHGAQVDIYAPGEDVYSTLPDDSYGEMSGTSMAAPLVAGVCGLTWSVAPSLSGDEIVDIVLNAWTTMTQKGSLVVNADASVRHALMAVGKLDAHENEVLVYQNHLMDILDEAASSDNGNPISFSHGARTYYGFAIGDMDGNGVVDLMLSYEQGTNDALCGNTVYTQNAYETLYSNSSTALLTRIVDARFYQSGAIELVVPGGAAYRYFMGANPDFLTATGIREGDYFIVGNNENGYSCGRGSAFETEPNPVSQRYYNELLDALTRGGPSYIAFQPFTEEAVKRISAKDIPAGGEPTEFVLPDPD